jgi:uncharacterized protein
MEPNYRRCISCRMVAPKGHFLRLVREHLTGKIELNQGMGRSAYICPTLSCIQLAQKKKRLDRALRATVPPSIYQALLDSAQKQSANLLNPR